jgi:hypothetical protein
MNRCISRLALSLLLGACARNDPAPPAEPVPAATPAPLPAPTPPPTPQAAATAEAPGAGDLATEEDFEDESNKAITAENLDAQLDALEKEILAE